ncbi:MAG TPA: HEAT repeat domain-containing protein [Myxococcota bacterium]|nr:HEAT repeat domain-containing protein [Myxococcota bacterium]
MERVERTREFPASSGRTPSDVATLLVELSRVVKARQFYAEGDPALAEILDRGFRSFRAEIERHGRLELEIGPAGVRMAQGNEPAFRGRLDDLARELSRGDVRALRFDSDLDLRAFGALVDALAGGGPSAPRASADLPREAPGGPLRVAEERAPAEPKREDAALLPPPPGPPTLAEAAIDEAPPVTEEKSAPTLDRAPLEAPPADERGARLVALLRELDGCTDHARYPELAAKVAAEGAALFEAGLPDEAYRTMRVLGMHASDLSRRSAPQREVAGQQLAELATGARLEALIARACARGAEASIRASQLLLQLGARVVPILLHRIEVEKDADRRGQLAGILIAIGEKATPELVRAMEAADLRRARTATRFAGEIQNPAAVATLRRLLQRPDSELRREAAKALVRIGHASAIDALVEALERRDDGVASLAAYCLGATASPRAFDALREALPRALFRGDFELARELVRAFARFGRSEAAPDLAAVLARKSLLKRRPLRELKLTAIDALAKLPGSAALQALAVAGESREPQVREAARRALARRPAQPAA